MTTPSDPNEIVFADLPLRERLPDYGALFAAGLGAALALAAIATVAFGTTFLGATTNILIAFAVILGLIGGATGGGYTNLGLGVFGSMARRDEHATLDDRLRRGLRPQANPRAFWQVVAAVLYAAIGVGLTLL